MVFLCVQQKTAYETRIRDWRSDVCSSDLSLSWPSVYPTRRLFLPRGGGTRRPSLSASRMAAVVRPTRSAALPIGNVGSRRSPARAVCASLRKRSSTDAERSANAATLSVCSSLTSSIADAIDATFFESEVHHD